jgi:hypothetical protein
MSHPANNIDGVKPAGTRVATSRDPRRGFGEYTDYDIRMRPDGSVLMFTWYKGHAWDGWIPNEAFRRAEEDGVLSWDSDGAPILDASKVRSRHVPDYAI